MKIQAVLGFAILGMIGLAVMACSSSDAGADPAPCPSVGFKACPNDPGLLKSDVDTCNESNADTKCGADYNAILVCSNNNIKCGADGKLDNTLYNTNCSTQQTTYETCVAGHDAGK